MADGQVFNFYNVGFASALLMAQKSSYEEPIQILWNTILQSWFPAVGGQTAYKLATKASVLANNDQPDAVVIEVRLVGAGIVRDSRMLMEYQIFMVECKSSEHDSDSGWASAAAQLTHYMEQNTNVSRKLFGAVAIGTKVQFYEWEYRHNRSSLRPVHPARLDLGDAGDRQTLEAMLDHVRTQGWNLAQQST
ncbi:hypothetical protein FGADI_6297 [Fusarium gaditjirri]|uniref:Uncharacterized protein n=1 Tax=Fusarium gaditjirri TaxID=282569 RepID=A0A8H4WWJ6_9HYPO|nr:hypothetical protein FGADI_6297 [Fusarium gaditjirri]